MREYLFDMKLLASIRVRAASVDEARVMLIKALDCADCNFGAWPNGSPITGEASLAGDDDGKDKIEFLECVEDEDSDEDEEAKFRNFYRCDDCSEEWDDEWSCQCDDECPTCGVSYTPYKSEDI